MTGATGNIYVGLHEFAEMAFLLHLLRPGDLFVDVGANIGSYSILASRVCGARAIAFEPDPGTCRALRRNIAANDVEPFVDVQCAAVGSSDGQVRFTTGLDTINRIATDDDRRTQTVQSIRLDSLAGIGDAVLMKLDVEGFESEVLKGAENLLGSQSLVAVETESRDLEVVRALTASGFSRALYDPFSRSLSPMTSASNDTGANALFVRDCAQVDSRVQGAPYRNIFGVIV